MSSATQDSRLIVATAHSLLKDIFKAGHAYQKCGVKLGHIQPESTFCQFDLFVQSTTQTQNHLLMKTIDRINGRFPKSITVAATGLDSRWQTKREHVSPHYTTDWREVVRVKC